MVRAVGEMFSASHNAYQVPAGSPPYVVSASGCLTHSARSSGRMRSRLSLAAFLISAAETRPPCLPRNVNTT